MCDKLSNTSESDSDTMADTSDTKALDKKLLDACGRGNLSLAQAAVREGGNINCIDSDGWTPIMVAMFYRQQPVIKWLLSVDTLNTNIGQTVNSDTCLHYACLFCDSDIVREVVRRSEGGRVNQVNPDNHYTPVQVAVIEGNVGAVVGMMGDETVDWGVTDKEGRSLLEMARYGMVVLCQYGIGLGYYRI